MSIKQISKRCTSPQFISPNFYSSFSIATEEFR